MTSLPWPRPQYVTDEGGSAYFNPGDVVRMRNPLDDVKHLVGVVVVDSLAQGSDKMDWFVRWENGYVDSFDHISGDDLVVVISSSSEERVAETPSVQARRSRKVSDTREYAVTVNMWIEYEADEENLSCNLSEHIDEHIDPLSVLHEHLVMDVRSAIWELSLTEGPDINVRTGGADVVNVSDVTGE